MVILVISGLRLCDTDRVIRGEGLSLAVVWNSDLWLINDPDLQLSPLQSQVSQKDENLSLLSTHTCTHTNLPLSCITWLVVRQRQE